MARILAVTLNPAIDIACEAPRIQPTVKLRTHGQMHEPGGGGTNVARVIAELGGSPVLAYLSGGITGHLYDELLQATCIERHRFPMAGPVRISFVAHEAETDLEYRFVADGPEVSESELAPLFDFVVAHDADYVVASGSLPRGLPADTYARMADATARRGARFVLDTSSEALRMTLARSKVYLVKPSMGELAALAGRKLDENDAELVANEIVQSGAAENVVVSMGARGALLVNAAGADRIAAIPVKTVSAVGAGDSFVGAMTWWHAEGHPIEEAYRFGAAAGAATVASPGIEICHREDVLKFFNLIK